MTRIGASNFTQIIIVIRKINLKKTRKLTSKCKNPFEKLIKKKYFEYTVHQIGIAEFRTIYKS
jgi:hypothetical protein